MGPQQGRGLGAEAGLELAKPAVLLGMKLHLVAHGRPVLDGQHAAHREQPRGALAQGLERPLLAD